MMFNPFDEAVEGEAADLELIARIATGDRVALEQLVRRHQAWIFNIAVRMVCDPHDAEDVTQEVLIKVVTKLGSFAGRSQFRTWLYRIVSNHVLNMRSRSKEVGAVNFGQLGEYLEGLPD